MMSHDDTLTCLRRWYSGSYMGAVVPTEFVKSLVPLAKEMGKKYSTSDLWRFCFLSKEDAQKIQDAQAEGATVSVQTAVNGLQSWTTSKGKAAEFVENLGHSDNVIKPSDNQWVSVLVEASIPGKSILLFSPDLMEWLKTTTSWPELDQRCSIPETYAHDHSWREIITEEMNLVIEEDEYLVQLTGAKAPVKNIEIDRKPNQKGFPVFDDEPETPYQPARISLNSSLFKKADLGSWIAGSKIVDEQGKPLRVYHGTTSGPGENSGFSPSPFGYIYVTPDATYANGYGYGQDHKVYPLFARSTNPLDLRPLGLRVEKDVFAAACDKAGIQVSPYRFNSGSWPVFQWVKDTGFKEACEAAGYDAIWLRENDLHGAADALLLFRAQQLKSAIGNRGTYDPGDERLTAKTADWHDLDDRDCKVLGQWFEGEFMWGMMPGGTLRQTFKKLELKYPTQQLYRYCWLTKRDIALVAEAEVVRVQTASVDKSFQSWTEDKAVAEEFSHAIAEPPHEGIAEDEDDEANTQYIGVTVGSMVPGELIQVKAHDLRKIVETQMWPNFENSKARGTAVKELLDIMKVYSQGGRNDQKEAVVRVPYDEPLALNFLDWDKGTAIVGPARHTLDLPKVDRREKASKLLKKAHSIPSILYHGSRPGLTQLVPKNDRYTTGVFLVDTPEQAASFGKVIYRVKVMGAHNPFVVDARGEFYSEIPTPQVMKDDGFTYRDTVDTDLIAKYALGEGYDCVIIENVMEGFSAGGTGLSHQTGTDYIMLRVDQMQIMSSFSYEQYKGRTSKLLKKAQALNKKLYHGTNAEFKEFELRQGWRGIKGLLDEQVQTHAVFLTDSIDFAKGRGERVLECQVSLQLAQIANLMPLHTLQDRMHESEHEWVWDEKEQREVLHLKGDEIIEALYSQYEPEEVRKICRFTRHQWQLFDDKKFVDALKSAGFIAAVFEENEENTDTEGTTWAILDPALVHIIGVQ